MHLGCVSGAACTFLANLPRQFGRLFRLSLCLLRERWGGNWGEPLPQNPTGQTQRNCQITVVFIKQRVWKILRGKDTWGGHRQPVPQTKCVIEIFWKGFDQNFSFCSFSSSFRDLATQLRSFSKLLLSSFNCTYAGASTSKTRWERVGWKVISKIRSQVLG